MQAEKATYHAVQHALRDAFGDPRCNYGALRWSGVKYHEGTGLDNLEKAAEDGAVMRIVRALCDDWSMAVLVAWYGYTEKVPTIWFEAVKPLADGLMGIYPHPEFKQWAILNCIGRFLPYDKRPVWFHYDEAEWMRITGMSQGKLHDLDKTICTGLRKIKKLTEYRIGDELAAAGLIRSDDGETV